MSQTESQKQAQNSAEETQSQQYQPIKQKQRKQSKSKKTDKPVQSKQKQTKQDQVGKGRKKGGKQKEKKENEKEKEKKEQKKDDKQKKQGGKRKPKSKNQSVKENNDNKSKVLQYMQKQNRPYNLLNIFDNLHGKIKKSELEPILNELTEEGQFSCKQFGKNKVYFINQDKFDLDMKQVQQFSHNYTHLKEEQKQLRDQNKRLNDQYRKLISKKTLEELQLEASSLSCQIAKLKKKKLYLISQDIQKVDEQQVKKIQKQSQFLQKELKKRRNLTKECLQTWAEITQKKVIEVAQMMGIQLV